MLLSFGAKNFYCFKEWITIDLTFNSKVPAEVSHGQKCSLTMCLKGGNASGKSNALRILTFLSDFCTNSFGKKPEEKIAVLSFFSNESPINFFISFDIGNIEYLYELSLIAEEVISEKIHRKEKRKTLVFHREKDVIKKNLLSSVNEFPLRRNASIISILKQFEVKEFDGFYNFFKMMVSRINNDGVVTGVLSDIHMSSFYYHNKEYLDFTKKYLKKFDTGIVDIQINHYERDNKEKRYFPVFSHDSKAENNTLLFMYQSSGTQSLYLTLGNYYWALKHGSILILDEFDINLHPDILPHLIELFEDKKTNPKNAQVLFSTHNSDIIDLMGKYKTYLFNKKKSECFAYRLDELSSDVIRNDRPILPLYKAGKIGGVPRI